MRKRASLHITFSKEHPVYKWINEQADKAGARGHIGTHLDCYTSVPDNLEYILGTVILDCTKDINTIDKYLNLPLLIGKALILQTNNLQNNGYGSPEYLQYESYLSKEIIEILLLKKPLFILIDSHGIGKPGKEHVEFDKLFERNGCHVIENIDLSILEYEKIKEIQIQINKDNKSTGKPCKVYVVR